MDPSLRTVDADESNCVDYGGKTSVIPGFASSTYWSSNRSNTNAWRMAFTDGTQSAAAQTASNYDRCVRTVQGSAAVPPTGLSLAQSEQNSGIVIASWTGGSGNGGLGGCVAEFKKDGATWVRAPDLGSFTDSVKLNCDETTSMAPIYLPMSDN